MKRLLALDQSSKITGYAVFDKDGKLETYGKFTATAPSVDERLVEIKNKIQSLIDQYNIEQIALEDIQQQENVQTFKILAEVYGVASEVIEEFNIPHTSVLASSWKSYLGIKGKSRQEQKHNAQKYVIEHYGIKPSQDECDAICIGLYQSANDWSN